jgi:two-component system NtrC family sensor kinase
MPQDRDPRADLALVGAVARLLSAGLPPERTLAAVAETLRNGLPARRVAFWLRDPASEAFRAIPGPDGDAAAGSAPGLDQLPPLAADALRVPLLYEGDRFGLLEAELEPNGRGDGGEAALSVVAAVLGPFLTSLEISEDLAFEVALQSREIQEQRRFTDLIIDSLPLGLYVVDREYRIQIWNRKRETGTQGLRREEVMGRPVFEVLTRQPEAELRADFDRVFTSGELQQAEIEVPGPEPRIFRISRIPMRLDDGEVTHVITIGEDVTEWRAIQHRIMQSEKLAAIGQLAAGIMHEINNPLATISACAAALEGRVAGQGPEADATAAEYLDIIEKEVRRCSRIVDSLLEFSRPKIKARAPLDLNRLLDETLFLLKHHQRFKRVEVARDFHAKLPQVDGNSEQLIQVFMALMLNAVDAMDRGGRLVVRTRPDTAREDQAVAEIEDSGVGIPREFQRKIFEPFFTTKEPGRGTGLGLSICYGIIEEHRGRIEVDSQPGRGTTMRVYLPLTADGSRGAGA